MVPIDLDMLHKASYIDWLSMLRHEGTRLHRAAEVCGSDLDGFLEKSKKRVPPLVLGHEFSGEVIALRTVRPSSARGIVWRYFH